MTGVRKVVVIGSGGHAKVVIDILKSDPTVRLAGCTTKAPGTEVSGIPVLGDDSVLPRLYEEGIRHAFVAIGDNRLREKLCRETAEAGFGLVNAISPRAYIAESATLGSGIAVMAGAVIHAEAHIGDYAVINTNASVDHECRIGTACHIAPGSALSGNVTVGTGTLLGTGTKVIDGIRIGAWSVVGAGAAVVRDIPDDCTAVGVPARVIKQRN